MSKQEQIEKLTKAIRNVQMENLSQATSVYACAPQIAEALYTMGCRQQGKIAVSNERGYNLGLIDGAKQFAEKIKSKMQEMSDPREGEPCAEFSASDIDKMLNEVLKNDK